MKFWDVFKTTAYFRASWHIQDIFIGAFRNAKKEIDDVRKHNSLIKNRKEWTDKLYNNNFHRNRKKK